jgi:DNA polymerase I-like protein with 3'-5' exonuclease and polymerase domains
MEDALSTSTRKTSSIVERAVRMVENAEVVALDLETTGLDPRGADIRLVQVSDGEQIYVIDLFKRDAGSLFEALGRDDLIVLAHGGDFEWRFVYHHFGVALENIVDTMLLSQLAFCGDMSEGVGLGAMAESELEVVLDKDMQKADWTLDPLPRRQLDYAAMDVKVLPPLYELLTEVIEDTGQRRVAEIENAAMPAFALMQYVGMPVDKEAWDRHAEETEAELRDLERRMLDADWMPPRPLVPQTWALQGADCLAMLRSASEAYENLTGTTAKDLTLVKGEIIDALLAYRKAKGDERERLKKRVLELAPEKPPKPAQPWNFGSSAQVAEITYAILGVELPDTKEGTLLRYRGDHPFVEHMLKHRELKKLVSTYGKTWFQKAYSSEAGRVYPAWRQIGTSTGRVASGERNVAPNAQNLPKSHRKFFVAPEGRVFVDADYSQIEVRVLAKMLNEERLLRVYGRLEDDAQSGDVYRTTAAYLLGVEAEAVTKAQRNLAKAIVLGMNYGLSAYGLPQYAFTNLGIKDMTTEEAEEYVESFYDLYPKIRDFHDDTLDTLEEMGSVDQRTLTGRLRGEITNRNEAINAPIQGTSADVLKRAMALAYGRLKAFDDAFVVASIHDELLVECNEGDAEAVAGVVEASMLEAADEILNADEPRVKIEVDVAVNKRWVKG